MKESSNSLRIYAQERFPEKSQIPTEKKIEISLDRILQDPGPGSRGCHLALGPRIKECSQSKFKHLLKIFLLSVKIENWKLLGEG